MNETNAHVLYLVTTNKNSKSSYLKPYGTPSEGPKKVMKAIKTASTVSVTGRNIFELLSDKSR